MIKAKKKGEDSEGLFFWKRRGKSGGEIVSNRLGGKEISE
jgi:hypothetical protein